MYSLIFFKTHKIWFHGLLLSTVLLAACDEGTFNTTSGAGTGLSQPVSKLALIAVRYQTRTSLSTGHEPTTCDNEMRISFQGENAYISKRLLGCSGNLDVDPFSQPGPTAINRATTQTVTCSELGRGRVTEECSDGSRRPDSDPLVDVVDSTQTSRVNEQLLIDTSQMTYQRTDNGNGQFTYGPNSIIDPGKTERFNFSTNEKFSIRFNGDYCSMDRYNRNHNQGGLDILSSLRSGQSCTVTYQ